MFVSDHLGVLKADRARPRGSSARGLRGARAGRGAGLLRIRRFILAVGLCGAAGCGSGFVAIFSDDGDSGSSSVPPPPLLVTRLGGKAPLLPPGNYLMEVELRNQELPATLSRIAVRLTAFDSVVDEQILFRVPRANTVEFLYGTNAIRAEARRRWGPAAVEERDVPALLWVLVDGVAVAAPVPLILLHQPRAMLETVTGREVVSPLGTSVVRTHLTSIDLEEPAPGTAEPGTPQYVEEVTRINELRMRVIFGNDLGSERQAAIVDVQVDPGGNTARVTGLMPATGEPAQAIYVIDSIPAGRSTLVTNVFYRPEIFGTSPATGASEGGSPVVLTGQALVPSRFPGDEPDFDSLMIKVRKGGRETEVTGNLLRRELSSRNRLVFPMPPSPDGRPGPADIVLEATVDAFSYPKAREQVIAESRGVFVYGDSYSYFGPRGAQLREPTVVTRLFPFVQPGSGVSDALALSSGAEGMPFVTMMAARGNGLFTRFGLPVRAGRTGEVFQRHPVDMCVADFRGDGEIAGVIINRGFQGVAQHGTILGDPTTNPPLRFNDAESLPKIDAGLACAGADLNGDGMQDLIVVPEPGGVLGPVLFLSEAGSRTFVPELFSVGASASQFTAVSIADLDGDGHQDLLFAAGGASPRLLIAYGNGVGGFPEEDRVDLQPDMTAAGYTPDAASRVVGLHAAGPVDGLMPVLVLGGVRGSQLSPPALLWLRRASQPRRFVAPGPGDLLRYPGAYPFVTSTSGHLMGPGTIEIVVAFEDAVEAPLRVFRPEGIGSFVEAVGAVEPGTELPRGIRGMGIGPAVGAGTFGQDRARAALFVTHEAPLGGGTEHRISTYFVDDAGPGPRLLSPHATSSIPRAIRGIAAGRFGPSGPAHHDVWVAFDDALKHCANDGLGELQAMEPTIAVPDLIPETLVTMRSGSAAGAWHVAPVFLTRQGAIGMIAADAFGAAHYLEAPGHGRLDLRRFAPSPLQDRVPQATSRIVCEDVDNDGLLDLLVMVVLSTAVDLGLEGETMLLLLAGNGVSPAVGFPFSAPELAPGQASMTHGNASAVVVADFAHSLMTGNTKELAVAVPRGDPSAPHEGNHVRFYRIDGETNPGGFVQSFRNAATHTLTMGSEPALLVAADYNADQRTDLACVTRGDHTLWVFYNYTTPGTSRDVDIGGFQGAPGNPVALPIASPRSLLGGDLNGDRVPDLVLLLEEAGADRRQQIVYLIGPGMGTGTTVRMVPPERTGDLVMRGPSWEPRRAAVQLALSDLNGDETPDLVLGWGTAGTAEQNLGVLFGNNF